MLLTINKLSVGIGYHDEFVFAGFYIQIQWRNRHHNENWT